MHAYRFGEMAHPFTTCSSHGVRVDKNGLIPWTTTDDVGRFSDCGFMYDLDVGLLKSFGCMLSLLQFSRLRDSWLRYLRVT